MRGTLKQVRRIHCSVVLALLVILPQWELVYALYAEQDIIRKSVVAVNAQYVMLGEYLYLTAHRTALYVHGENILL